MPVSVMFLTLDVETLELRTKIEIHSIWSFYKCIIIKTLPSDTDTCLSDLIHNNFIKGWNIWKICLDTTINISGKIHCKNKVLWSDFTENLRTKLTYVILQNYQTGYIFHFKHLTDILLRLSDLKTSAWKSPRNWS